MRYILLFALICLLLFSLAISQEKKQSRAMFDDSIYVDSEARVILTVKKLIKEDFVYITIRTTFKDRKKVYEIRRLGKMEK